MATRPSPPALSEEEQDPGSADLSTLRSILFGADRARLEELSRRIRERQIRADDVAEVLPEAFVREFERSPHRLKEAVRQPIEETLREAVRTDPRPIADAIFPVIGPAIRRYITASIRALADSLSRTIERGLSPRRQLAWRFKAWRAGLSFGQYVLQRTFIYRVEHVYLIQAGSGLLVGEAHHGDSPLMDSDAISGMLSALQSFVLDSFEPEADQQLKTADLGDFTLWAIHGPYAMLALAIRGAPGADLRNRLEDALEDLHLRHGRYLETFDGSDEHTPHDLEHQLERCLYKRHADRIENRRRVGWQTWAVLLIVAGLLLRFLTDFIGGELALDRLARTLQQTPGVVITAIDRSGEQINVRGLRDPLAPSLAQLAEQAGVGDHPVSGTLEPYQSLEPTLVLARLSRALEQPDTVELRLQSGVLYVDGEADAQWVKRIRAIDLLSPAVERIDTRGLRVADAALLQTVRRELQPPEGLTLAVTDGVLEASGVAPIGWIVVASERALLIDGLDGVDFGAVAASELLEAKALVETIGGRAVLFERGTSEYREDPSALLERSAGDILALAELARLLGRPLIVHTTGHTDAAGDAATNAELRRARAESVRADLVRYGVPEALIEVHDAGDADDLSQAGEDPTLRRTEIRPVIDLSRWQYTAAP